jgi:hypothetical protein
VDLATKTRRCDIAAATIIQAPPFIWHPRASRYPPRAIVPRRNLVHSIGVIPDSKVNESKNAGIHSKTIGWQPSGALYRR